MSREERYGQRDMAYSNWHRKQADNLKMIDLDWIEYCQYCWEPLAVIETTQDVGQPFKQADVTRNMARRADIRGLLVFYKWDDAAQEMVSLRVTGLWPKRLAERTMTPGEYLAGLQQLRSRHHCLDDRGQTHINFIPVAEYAAEALLKHFQGRELDRLIQALSEQRE